MSQKSETNDLGFKKGGEAQPQKKNRNPMGFESGSYSEEGPQYPKADKGPLIPKPLGASSGQTITEGEEFSKRPDQSHHNSQFEQETAEAPKPQEGKQPSKFESFAKEHPILTAGLVGAGCIGAGGLMVGFGAATIATGGAVLVAAGAALCVGAAVGGVCYGAYKLGEAVGKAFNKWNDKRKARNECKKEQKKALASIKNIKSMKKSSQTSIPKQTPTHAISDPTIASNVGQVIQGFGDAPKSVSSPSPIAKKPSTQEIDIQRK